MNSAQLIFRKNYIPEILRYILGMSGNSILTASKYSNEIEPMFINWANSIVSSLEILKTFREYLINSPHLNTILELIKEEGELTNELALEYAPYLLGSK